MFLFSVFIICGKIAKVEEILVAMSVSSGVKLPGFESFTFCSSVVGQLTLSHLSKEHNSSLYFTEF